MSSHKGGCHDNFLISYPNSSILGPISQTPEVPITLVKESLRPLEMIVLLIILLLSYTPNTHKVSSILSLFLPLFLLSPRLPTHTHTHARAHA